MQVNLDATELEKTNRAAHGGHVTAETARVRGVLQSGRGRSVWRNQQAHRQHVGFVETVALEEILRAQFRAIREQGNAEEFLLLGEGDRVLE
jgi:hypothetical protein